MTTVSIDDDGDSCCGVSMIDELATHHESYLALAQRITHDATPMHTTLRRASYDAGANGF
jgi:hypothetical protein